MNRSQHHNLVVFLMLTLLFVYNVSTINSLFGFDFTMPDIPFLNFNFNFGGESSHNDVHNTGHTSITDLLDSDGKSTSSVSSSEHGDESDKLSKNVETNSFPLYESLPFPSNTNDPALMSSNVSNEEDVQPNELAHIKDKMQVTFPLLANLDDIPSTFLSNSGMNNEASLNQYIIVFKNEDTTVADFMSSLAGKINPNDIMVLTSSDVISNNIVIKLKNKSDISYIKHLANVDHVDAYSQSESKISTHTKVSNIFQDGLSLNRSKTNETKSNYTDITLVTPLTKLFSYDVSNSTHNIDIKNSGFPANALF